jgi:branched-subunit amino acid aminotransferase/4-amino-4-deoxychorismate lyase
MSIVWLDGRYLPERQAKLPVTDPVVRWGTGVFEVVRGYHRRPFRLGQHLARMAGTARLLGIDRRIPDLGRVIPRLFARNRLEGGYVRITLTGGGRLLVEVRGYRPPPARVYREGALLDVAHWRRDPAAPLAGLKTVNYLELMMARERARERGAIDTVLLAPDGSVLEGARSNVFVVRRGRIETPRAEGAGVLPGVTRALVIELAREEGIAHRERRLGLEDLHGADEVFVTSTMMEVVPVARIGRRRVAPPGPLTRTMSSAYSRRVEQECAPARGRRRD